MFSVWFPYSIILLLLVCCYGKSNIPSTVDFFTSTGVLSVPVANTCYVTEFDAWPGHKDSTVGIQAAIDTCRKDCEHGKCVDLVILPKVEDNYKARI